MSKQRHERPVRRVNPSGKVVWYARYTDARGRRRSAGTYRTKREAQEAIDAAYGRAPRDETVGGYFAEWPRRHPRAKRTQDTNEHRVSRALDIQVEGRLLRDWPLGGLRRRHVLAVLDVLLRDQRRSARGAMHIIRALGLMAEDAITDEVVDVNPFRGMRVRGNDPRVSKGPRPTRVFSFEQMHRFAAAAGRYEPMVRTFADTGLRLGEVLPLRRSDLRDGVLHVVRTAHEGEILEGTRPITATPRPGVWSRVRRGCSSCCGRCRRASIPSCCSRRRARCSGASGTSIAMCGTRRRSVPGSMSARTRCDTATSAPARRGRRRR